MVGRSRAFTKKTAKVQKMGIFTSPQKLRRGGSIVSLTWPEAEFTSATYTGVILALRRTSYPSYQTTPVDAFEHCAKIPFTCCNIRSLRAGFRYRMVEAR